MNFIIIYEEEVPHKFDIAVLLHILYDDFLSQVKKGAKNEQIANYLLAGKKITKEYPTKENYEANHTVCIRVQDNRRGRRC